MSLSVTAFNKINILDACAIWNILSCRLFYCRCIDESCSFSFTKFVEYECLGKPRHNPSKTELAMQAKLRMELVKGKFSSHNLSLSDIQDVSILRARKNLGLGELSSIAFAKKINQNFLTDDQNARKLASQVLGGASVQTTPQLFGHLIFKGSILEVEVEEIIAEHKESGRPLEKYFRYFYEEAMRIRLMTS